MHWKDAEAETPILWATWCEELTLWKRLWCWERLEVGGEGDNGEWDGWMASPTKWKWVWVNSGSWWWTGKPGMLQSMGLQRVGHNWVTELNWTELNQSHNMSCFYLAAYRFCMSTSPNQGYLRPSLSFHNKAFSLFCLPLSINQMSCDGWLPCYSKFWIKSLWLLSFGIKLITDQNHSGKNSGNVQKAKL